MESKKESAKVFSKEITPVILKYVLKEKPEWKDVGQFAGKIIERKPNNAGIFFEFLIKFLAK